ncbi:hypothetical protein KFK09_019529 [Dendrobium nobile]|uniref:Uncharacterized protein n=1 Tax=Dendrobium nobile TaxID=94219 RepID=A0A8T3AQI9_DENNO|nr:hypothetical protein KFK09_019529 [Dendrobium nobile]
MQIEALPIPLFFHVRLHSPFQISSCSLRLYTITNSTSRETLASRSSSTTENHDLQLSRYLYSFLSSFPKPQPSSFLQSPLNRSYTTHS